MKIRMMEDRRSLTYVLTLTAKLLYTCNPTSKRQGKQPHTHSMQMLVYILHVYVIYISNMLPFAFHCTIPESCHVADSVAP